ncbi:MAG TPA: cysteine--tRNA ligase [Ignavibacteriales bacterium]|nr:cysteine--tRNA ligase [Ignavibacteriales bacterium]
MLSIYNTLTRKKEEFIPISPDEVRMYVCGPTVYDYFHIGNARSFIMADVLRKYLEYKGYNVKYIMNLTDIDDRIIKKSIEEKIEAKLVAEKYTKAFFDDIEKLKVKQADVYPKATDHVQEIVDFIKQLEEKSFAYNVDGNVFYDVSKFHDYGKLSGKKLVELEAGARVDVNEEKKNPLDFALWKKAKEGEPFWESPWGKGRPGWHIECSAMSMKYLGESFDIHAGGIDHVPVHHTNEIAQSEAATGKTWVKYWMHAEFLIMDKGKMSKSKGGFMTLQSLIDSGLDPLDYRYFCLGGHYRSQLTFSWESMEQAKASRKALAEKIVDLREKAGDAILPKPSELAPAAAERLARFDESLADDLSVPRALAELWQLVRDPQIPPAHALSAAIEMDSVLGLGLASARRQESSLDAALVGEIERLVGERAAAKKAKDWASADAIRVALKGMGIALEDGPTGTIWKKL